MFKLESQGFAEIQRLLERLPAAVSEEKTRVALHLAAQPTAERAQALCPRGAGAVGRQARKSVAVIERQLENPTPLQARALAEGRTPEQLYPQLAELREEAAGHGGKHLAEAIDVFDAEVTDGRVAVFVSYPRRFYYGHFLEWGTSRMAARPFLRPAWDSTKGEYLDDFARLAWNALRVELLGSAPSRAA